MATPTPAYDPSISARWLDSMSPAGTASSGGGSRPRRVHNVSGMTPASAARAYARATNVRVLDSLAREQVPTATPINGPTTTPQVPTTPQKPPKKETPPPPTESAPTGTVPAPPPPPPVPEEDPSDDDIKHQVDSPPATTPAVPSQPAPAVTTPRVQPGVSAQSPEVDPLLEANGPNTDALPMPSTEGREVGKPWTEQVGSNTVEFTIAEGNGLNTVDAIVRDAAGNELSRARIVALEGTAKYVRWQNYVGGGASYYESGGPNGLGYGQHFAPGTSTAGIPTSVFVASPDLTKVRTISYDQFGNPIGIDVGSRNESGLYDNDHSDMYGNDTFTSTSFNAGGGLDSKFIGQIDAAGNGWMVDAKGNRWDIYPDDLGNSVQRRVNPATNGYEFKYTENGIQIHELRDKSGRLLELSKTAPDGRPIKQLRRVGDILATGVPGADGKFEFTFTDSTSVGTSFFTLPWEDRPVSRTGELTITPNGGLKLTYADGGLAEFGADGKLTAFRPADDTRALWKKAVSFAGSYYYGVASSALGAVVGISALAGVNDQINFGAKIFGSDFQLASRQDALNGIAGGFGELIGTAFNAYKTLGVEAYGIGAGEQSWGEAWRNVRRAVGANWNATSKLVIGTDWQGASGNLAETLGHAAFGTAMFFIPVKGTGAIGKGPKPGTGAAARGITLGTFRPSVLSSATHYINSRAMSARAAVDGLASKAARYGREQADRARNWGSQPVKSLNFVADVVTKFFADLQPQPVSASGAHSVPTKPPTQPDIFATAQRPGGSASPRNSAASPERRNWGSALRAPDDISSYHDGPYNARAFRDMLEEAHGSSSVTSTTVAEAGGRMIHMAAKRHPITNVPYDNRGFPIFDRYAEYDTRFPARVFDSASYSQQLKMASRDLYAAIQRGEVNSSRFTAAQLEQLRRGDSTIDGYTWHHHQDHGRMQLVIRRIHSKTGHIGGESMSKGR